MKNKGKMMKILLILCIYYDKKNYRYDRKRVFWEPLGISYLADYLRREGYIVDLFYPMAYGMDKEQVKRYFKEKKLGYDYIGISVPSFQTKDAREMIDMLRVNGYIGPIFLGGLAATCLWEEFLDIGADAIILGEGEITTHKLVEFIEKKKDYRQVKGIAFNVDMHIMYIHIFFNNK